MARRTGLSRTGYQDFENGYGHITLANLAKVLGVLGLTHHLAQLVPPVAEEPTLAALLYRHQFSWTRDSKPESQ